VTSNYGYDQIYELLSATQGGTTTESYTYDPVGNRLSSLGLSPYQYNVSNELTQTPNTIYAQDANGNTTIKTDSTGNTIYTWDYENRLTSVTRPGTGGTLSFKYDPLGRRIQKSFTQPGNPPSIGSRWRGQLGRPSAAARQNDRWISFARSSADGNHFTARLLRVMGDTPMKSISVTLLLICIVPAVKAQEQVNAVQCKADLKMWTGGFDSRTMLSDGWTVSIPELKARETEMKHCVDASVTGKGKHQKMNYADASNYMLEAGKYSVVNVQRMRMYIMRHNGWETFEAENVAQFGRPIVDPAPLVQHALTPDECWANQELYRRELKDYASLPFDTLHKRSLRMADCVVVESESRKEALLAAQGDMSVDINYIANLGHYRIYMYATLGNFYDYVAGLRLWGFLLQHNEYDSFVTEDASNRAAPRIASAPETTPIGQIILPYDDLNGSMLVKISINGRETTATFDSGADNVTANLSKFAIVPDSRMNVQFADGRVTSKDAGEGVVCAGSPQVCLRVSVCDTAADADVLLGQSFLSHFTKVMVDRRQHAIVLEP
jgi:YD repeat-containing protein